MEISILHRQGNSIKEIARKTGLARNTIRKFLRAKQIPNYERKSGYSKLDAYKEYLQKRIK